MPETKVAATPTVNTGAPPRETLSARMGPGQKIARTWLNSKNLTKTGVPKSTLPPFGHVSSNRAVFCTAVTLILTYRSDPYTDLFDDVWFVYNSAQPFKRKADRSDFFKLQLSIAGGLVPDQQLHADFQFSASPDCQKKAFGGRNPRRRFGASDLVPPAKVRHYRRAPGGSTSAFSPQRVDFGFTAWIAGQN